MPARRSIRNRRRPKISVSFDLQLTSMLDVLVILLVFLLKSISTNQATLPSTPGLEMPRSVSPDFPGSSPQLIITPEAMFFEGERILEFQISAGSVGTSEGSYEFEKTDLDEGSRRILPLYNVLTESREKSELLRAKSKARDQTGRPLAFEGVLAIQADRRINYDILRKVMYTSATAGFKVFRFLAQKKEL